MERGCALDNEDATDAEPSGTAETPLGATQSDPSGTPSLRALMGLAHGRQADPLADDPTLAPILPALRSWSAVPGGCVVCSDAGLAHHLRHRFGVHVVPRGLPVRGPSLQIPAFVDRGPAAVDAALRSFGRGREILPDLAQLWRQRLWLGGWGEIASALAELDARCAPGPLHMLGVRAHSPGLVVPPAPRLVLELWVGSECVALERLVNQRLQICSMDATPTYRPGDALVAHPAWPSALTGAVVLAWGRDGLQVRLTAAVRPWQVRAGASVRGECAPVSVDGPVLLGCDGVVSLHLHDAEVARVVVRPEQRASATPSPARPAEAVVDWYDRQVLVEVILEGVASTEALADALPPLLALHTAPGGEALAARLGPRPIQTLGRWLADPRNDALRLALADALAQTEAPSALRARLPRALRCWIPQLGGGAAVEGLRLVVGGSSDA